MKANRLAWTFLLLLLSAAAFQLPAEQNEADRKLFEEIKTKAEKSDAQSQSALGRAYFFGNLGMAKDDLEAVKWFRKAAEQNHAPSQFTLGFCYDFGRGVAEDEVEAVKWYRKAAEQNDANAQFSLGVYYAFGRGVAKDEVEAVKWVWRAAEQNCAPAQYYLGVCHAFGQGVTKNEVEAVRWFRKAAADAQASLGICYLKGDGVAKNYDVAVKWFRKAAEQGCVEGQVNLGTSYFDGQGVIKDQGEAVKWFRKAAEQGDDLAQAKLGGFYDNGVGVAKDYVEAYKWYNLSAAQGNKHAEKLLGYLENRITPEQIAEGQQLTREFKPRKTPSPASDLSRSGIIASRPDVSGTGFFISEDGYLVTNEHVVKDAGQIRLVTSAGFISAKVVKVDAANDLALLKAEGRFAPLPLASSRAVKLGGTVATVGFPNIGLQGFAPKFARGEIASLSGAQDDARYFQISVPVQPGNSGGALVDERGNVVGVVSAKLSARAALSASGALPENVNYAVKSSFLLGFLESVPEVSAKLKEPNTKEQKFEDVVKAAEEAAVLVLVY